MQSESPKRSGARPAFWLAMSLTTIGLYGMFSSVNQLQTPVPVKLDAIGSSGDMPEATRLAVEGLLTTFAAPPIRRGLAVVNFLTSSLLVMASVLVTTRARLALWLVGQALIANVLFAFANIVGTLWVLMSARSTLIPLFEAHFEAQLPAEILADIPDHSGFFWFIPLAFALGSSLVFPIYYLLYRLARRPDLRRFLGA